MVSYSELANQLNLKNPAQLLFAEPDRYIDCRKSHPISTVVGSYALIQATLRGQKPPEPNRKYSIFVFEDTQGTMFSHIAGEGKPTHEYLSQLKDDTQLYLHGRVELNSGYYQMKQVVIPYQQMLNRITPWYRAIRNKVSGEHLTNFILQLHNRMNNDSSYLDGMAKQASALFHSDTPVASILSRYGFEDIQQVLATIAAGTDGAAYKSALHSTRALNVADYLINQNQRNISWVPRKLNLPIQHHAIFKGFERQGVELTRSQQSSIHALLDNLNTQSGSGRGILSGDVGTGKSFVITAGLAGMSLAGGASACLVLNQELAQEMYNSVRRFFPNIPVELVTERSKPDVSSLQNNTVLIGTTALLFYSDDHQLAFDLAIIDEEQKFGSSQKSKLCTGETYQLLSTATCIPKTLQLAKYNEHDWYELTERKYTRDVTTRLVTEESAAQLFQRAVDVVDRNKQVLVVLPAVEDKQGSYLAATSIEKVFENWNRAFPGVTCAFHGKLSSAEREEVMRGIKEGQYKVIIASTATEVGLNIPNLIHCICCEPHRFGASQLHQIRGRVGRFGDPSYFDMFATQALGEKAMARIQILLDEDDGRRIAERELALRGFGSMHQKSAEQSGKPVHLILGREITPQEVDRAQALGLLDKTTEQGVQHAI